VFTASGSEEAHGLELPLMCLSREVSRRVTYALRRLEGTRFLEFIEFCKLLTIIRNFLSISLMRLMI